MTFSRSIRLPRAVHRRPFGRTIDISATPQVLRSQLRTVRRSAGSVALPSRKMQKAPRHHAGIPGGQHLAKCNSRSKASECPSPRRRIVAISETDPCIPLAEVENKIGVITERSGSNTSSPFLRQNDFVRKRETFSACAICSMGLQPRRSSCDGGIESMAPEHSRKGPAGPVAEQDIVFGQSSHLYAIRWRYRAHNVLAIGSTKPHQRPEVAAAAG